MNKLPIEFKIAGQIIKINEIDDCDFDGNFGKFNSAKNEINIYRYIMSDNEKVKLTDKQIENTYWHEVFHVFNFFWNTETNEDLAQIFSNFMCEYNETVLR